MKISNWTSRFCVALLLGLSAGAAQAESFTAINPDSGEPSLFSVLDAIYGVGNYERVSDDLDDLWDAQDILGAIAISSTSAASQQLGLCVVCDGSDDTYLGPNIAVGSVFPIPLLDHLLVPGGPLFRWFDAAAGHSNVSKVFSDPLLNPGGVDQMVTFAIKDSLGVFVFAFEDVPTRPDHKASDRDFNDFMVEVRFAVAPPFEQEPPELLTNPEPASLALFGGALLLFGCGRRLRRPR